MSEVNRYGRASGSRLNVRKSEGLWLGPWRGRPDQPHGLTWTSTRLKVLGVWLGDGQRVALNYREHYASILSKLRTWSARPLSQLGRVKVANVFLYSRLWYRTEIMPLLPAGRADLIGYREVEREVANWVFRKRGSRRDERPRMQVSQERPVSYTHLTLPTTPYV